MVQYIDKDAVDTVLRKLWKKDNGLSNAACYAYNEALQDIQCEIDTLEVKDPYEQCVQYDSVKAGIQAHAETYSFNIESELFNQLTKEQQKLWRKEIEQACISGGDVGVELARDVRYKENLEVKEVDSLTPEEIKKICTIYENLKQERECATVLYNSDETFFNHVLMEYKSIAQKGE